MIIFFHGYKLLYVPLWEMQAEFPSDQEHQYFLSSLELIRNRLFAIIFFCRRPTSLPPSRSCLFNIISSHLASSAPQTASPSQSSTAGELTASAFATSPSPCRLSRKIIINIQQRPQQANSNKLQWTGSGDRKKKLPPNRPPCRPRLRGERAGEAAAAGEPVGPARPTRLCLWGRALPRRRSGEFSSVNDFGNILNICRSEVRTWFVFGGNSFIFVGVE